MLFDRDRANAVKLLGILPFLVVFAFRIFPSDETTYSA